MPVDLASADAATRAIRDAEKALDHIDVLVNNAGFGLYAPIESVPRGDLERLFAVNTFVPVATIQAALPGMRRRDEASLLMCRPWSESERFR